MSSKDLMVFLRTQGHNVSSHMSNIEETVAQILRDRLKPKLQKEKALKEKALREKALLEKAAAEKLAPKPLAAGSLSSGSGPGGATLQRDGSTIVTEGQAAERQKPGAERGGRLSPTAAGPKQAQWAEGDPDWSEAKEKEKEKVKEKEVGKEKEAPTRKRYF